MSRVWFFLIGISACSPALAQEIALSCQYEGTTDEKGNREGTVGDVSFLIQIAPDNTVVANSSKCARMTGTANDLRIDVQCAYKMGEVVVSEYFVIDRLNGAFTEFWKYGKGGLVHDGHCIATKRLF